MRREPHLAHYLHGEREDGIALIRPLCAMGRGAAFRNHITLITRRSEVDKSVESRTETVRKVLCDAQAALSTQPS